MSIQRYWVPNGTLNDQSGWHQDDNEVVLASEHDRELSALRDELADLKSSVSTWRIAYDRRTEERDELQQRLTAAEQRNAELVELLRSTAHTADDLLDQLINATEDFDEPISEEEIEEHRAVIATALKPTESGASK